MENAAEEDFRADGCDGPSKKKARRLCSAEGCTKYAQRGGVCARHGAKRKVCSVEGCDKQAKGGGFCMRHGGKTKVKRCSVEGCNNIIQKGGVCQRHGAKRKFKTCSVEGCTKRARKGGVCISHGAEAKARGSKGRASNAPDDGAGGDRGAGGRESNEGDGPAPAEEFDSNVQRIGEWDSDVDDELGEAVYRSGKGDG